MTQPAIHPSTRPAVPVTLLPSGRTIHVSPEEATRRVIAAPADSTPRFGIFRWQPAGDGTFRPIYLIHEEMMKSADLAKLVGISRMTLSRLAHAGFVACSQPSPFVLLVDVASYFAHQEAARDPDFWTESRRRQYGAVI